MGKARIDDFQRWKREGRRFACLTAYDAPTARILAGAGTPLLLVGDSVGNVVLGYSSTVPVTMEQMLHHTAAVRRGAPDTFIVADMPFLSYQVSIEEAVRNAGCLLKEAGADAVKIEGGEAVAATAERMVELGIPVMGHLGLTPQSSTLLGGMRVQGTRATDALEILRDAELLEQAGVFSLVLECVPAEVAARVSSQISVPTVGIGAGPGCDGQILVIHDVLGIDSGFRPRFVRRYAELENVIEGAVSRFIGDVTDGTFPADGESFHMSVDELERLDDMSSGGSGPAEGQS